MSKGSEIGETDIGFSLDKSCLPVLQRLSPTQIALGSRLTEVLSKSGGVSPEFIDHLIRALVIYGDCRGLAHLCRDGGGTILCRWLRSEVLLSIDSRQIKSSNPQIILDLVDRIDFALLAFREDPQYQLLFEAPSPSKNRLIHFHLSISGAPAYHLVAAKLHRGICSKVTQLRGLDSATFDDRLGGFVRPLARITNNIPTNSIRKHLHEYGEGEFDDLIETVIFSLPRMEIGPDGRSQYAPKTLRKYLSTWIAAFYKTANKKVYIRHSYHLNKSTQIDPLDSARADELPETHRLRSPFLELADQQALLEARDLEAATISKRHSRLPQISGSSGLRKIHKAKIPVLFIPSISMPGVLPLPVIAIITDGIDRLAGTFPTQEILAAKLMIHLLLHTGRPVNWLLDIQVGEKPNSPWDVSQPIWSVKSRVIYFVPEIYPCPPAPRLEHSAELTTTSTKDVANVYEKTNKIHRVPLSTQTAGLMQEFLRARNAAIYTNQGDADHLQCSDNSGALFILGNRLGLLPLQEEWFEKLLTILTAQVRENIPGYPRLRPTHFTRSFEGYYSSYGLRGIYRFYVSGRSGRRYEMPLKYSQVSFNHLFEEYFLAQGSLTEAIFDEVRIFSYLSKTQTPLAHQTPSLEDCEFEAAFFGSNRVLSQATLRSILKALQTEVAQAKIRQAKGAEEIALKQLIAVELGLFNGLRPFEVGRINWRSIDLDLLRLTVWGKARRGQRVYRCIPILPGTARLFKRLLSLGSESETSKRILFTLNDPKTGSPKAMSTKQLDLILDRAAVSEGWPSGSIYYALRHRFRTDMLSSGMAEQDINYLMGHEIMGEEPFSMYSERRYEKLREQYFRVADQLAERYGFLNRASFPRQSSPIPYDIP